MQGRPPEEDAVALVVEGGDLAALKVGILVEQRGQHAPQPVAQPSVKVIQNQLWLHVRRTSMPL